MRKEKYRAFMHGKVIHMDDTQIVELFWERKEEAIQAVSEKYAHFCLGIAWNILKNKEDAEECVNDTWLAVWKYIPPKRPAILTGFLGKITRGYAIDLLRKKYAAKRCDLHTDSLELLRETKDLDKAVNISVEDSVQEKELLQIINLFLQNSKRKDRDIFIRRYWYMDTLEEIAARHGCSVSAVKSNLFRMRKRLQKQLVQERYLV